MDKKLTPYERILEEGKKKKNSKPKPAVKKQPYDCYFHKLGDCKFSSENC